MPAGARLLTLAALVLAIALGAACSDTDSSAGSVGRGVNVQLAWRAARSTTGHDAHVAKQHVKCTQCHELSEGKVGAVAPQRCRSCHEKEASLRHAEEQAAKRFGPASTADCTLCHAFVDSRRTSSALGSGGGNATPLGPLHAEFQPSDCARCHAAAQGALPAVAVHGTSECVSCHRPHEDATPKAGPCATCHDKITTEHAKLDKSPQAVCTTCHQHQHAPASDALGTCATCHASTQPTIPASALFDGHSACVGCHRPHEFAKQAAAPCRSCHADVRVLAETRVQAHNQCTSCHAPHDVKGSPRQACGRCHTSVHSDHPQRGATGTCVGCHAPHAVGSQAREPARACSSCHQTAHTDKDFHQGVACSQCHKPHGFALAAAGTGLCANCHASEVSRVAQPGGHENCASCHKGLPHRPATLLAGCESCHGAQGHEVNPGHQRCATCHEPHAGAVTTTCAGCHEAQAHSAPVGHAKCVSCHQPHSGSTQKATCAGCHQPEAGSAHGQIAGGCANCHRPHGPKGVAKPPACATCHAPTSLLGLHRVAKHQNCSKCHAGHGDQPGLFRDGCLGCHTDRKAHYPDAPRCVGCHLFDTPRAAPRAR